jgi:hypothetical protein
LLVAIAGGLLGVFPRLPRVACHERLALLFVDEKGNGEIIVPLGKPLMDMRDTASMSPHDMFWR